MAVLWQWQSLSPIANLLRRSASVQSQPELLRYSDECCQIVGGLITKQHGFVAFQALTNSFIPPLPSVSAPSEKSPPYLLLSFHFCPPVPLSYLLVYFFGERGERLANGITEICCERPNPLLQVGRQPGGNHVSDDVTLECCRKRCGYRTEDCSQ